MKGKLEMSEEGHLDIGRRLRLSVGEREGLRPKGNIGNEWWGKVGF